MRDCFGKIALQCNWEERRREGAGGGERGERQGERNWKAQGGNMFEERVRKWERAWERQKDSCYIPKSAELQYKGWGAEVWFHVQSKQSLILSRMQFLPGIRRTCLLNPVFSPFTFTVSLRHHAKSLMSGTWWRQHYVDLLCLWSASGGSNSHSRGEMTSVWMEKPADRGCVGLMAFTVRQLNRSFTHQIKEKCPTRQPTKQHYRSKQQ